MIRIMVIRMILFRIIYLNVDGKQTRQHSNATKLVQSIMCVENQVGSVRLNEMQALRCTDY